MGKIKSKIKIDNKIIKISAIVVVVVLCIICILLIICGNKKEITGVKSFTFSTSGLTFSSYAFTCDKDCYDGQGKKLSKRKIKQVIDVLNKYKVRKWDGFNKDKGYGAFDSKTFKLDIILDDDSTIHAEGYEAFPKKYDKFEEEIEKILKRSDK